MAWLALATIYLVWGSTYLAIRVMVETMPPLLSAGIRFAIAGAVFWVALRLIRGAERVKVTRAQLIGAGIVGVLLCFGGNGLVTVAEQEVPSGLAALIIGSVPLWVVVLRSLHGDRVQAGTLAGVLLGFVGLALLVLPGDRPGDAPLWGLLLLIAAAISWACGSFYAKKLPAPDDLLVWTAWEMLLGGAAMIAVGLMAGEAGEFDPASFSADSWWAFLYLIVVGSLIAFSAYAWLLRHVPISTVATYAYVNPVIAIFLGWSILEEEITATMIAAAVAIVISVWTVVRREGETEAGEERSRGAGPASTGASPTERGAPSPRFRRPPAEPGGARAGDPVAPPRTPTPRA